MAGRVWRKPSPRPRDGAPQPNNARNTAGAARGGPNPACRYLRASAGTIVTPASRAEGPTRVPRGPNAHSSLSLPRLSPTAPRRRRAHQPPNRCPPAPRGAPKPFQRVACPSRRRERPEARKEAAAILQDCEDRRPTHRGAQQPNAQATEDRRPTHRGAQQPNAQATGPWRTRRLLLPARRRSGPARARPQRQWAW